MLQVLMLWYQIDAKKHSENMTVLIFSTVCNIVGSSNAIGPDLMGAAYTSKSVLSSLIRQTEKKPSSPKKQLVFLKVKDGAFKDLGCSKPFQ